MYSLLSNVAIVAGAETPVGAGRYAFTVWGTSIGQATVTLERKVGSGWLSIGAAAALTSFGHVGVDLPAGVYRANVTDGGTDPVGLFATLEPLS